MEKQKSILVVDDEQIICDSCHRILSNEDFKVDTNTNPQEGIEKALANNYDLILLDLNMRELDGMQFLAKLRKDKPDVPVIIITGYPTKETKDESKNLGVSNYILKPFKPSEILDPVNEIIKSHVPAKKKAAAGEKMQKPTSWTPAEKNYWFYKNGWLQKGMEDFVRVGGQFPVLMNEPISSIQLVKADEEIKRGFPIAQLNFSNDVKLIIPSPVSGKVVEINNELLKTPSIFEDEGNTNNWIATILPDQLEEDLKMCETRKVFLFTKEDKNKYSYQLKNLGYIVTASSTVEETLKAVSTEMEKVVVFDAVSYSETGPQFVKTIKEKFSDAKIIVFNVTDTKLETAYREQKIFYYAVDPITGKEVSSILYGAFCFAKDREVTESTQTTFLPPTINRVHITNKHSQKVALLAFDNTLQFNKGLGYLLIQRLHDKLYPIEINHTRNISKMKDPGSDQMIIKDKMKNDKIIVLCKDDMNKIPGSITRTEETFENSNGSGNTLIKIAVQPSKMDSEDIGLDINIARALAETLENEMSSK
jgi:CheY-like chemotaxis protein/glycine cleavage system H lipoate-binding protein